MNLLTPLVCIGALGLGFKFAEGPAGPGFGAAVTFTLVAAFLCFVMIADRIAAELREPLLSVAGRFFTRIRRKFRR